MNNTISKEIFFEESNDITNVIIIRENLECLIQDKTSSSINFKEECNEIKGLLRSSLKNLSLKSKGDKLHTASKKIKFLIDNYSEIISEKEYELLYQESNNIMLLSNFFIEGDKIKENLSDSSSIKVLKQWANWTELFAEILEINKKFLNKEKIDSLKELAEFIISVTFIKHPEQIKKNKLKRSLKYSATFILNIVENIVENCKTYDSWQLVVGNKSYEELLLESQKRIGLLDELEPKNKDEEEIQIETLKYIEYNLK